MSSGSQDGKVSFRRLCNSHLLIFVLLSTSHLLIFILQCISHICNSYLHISLLLIISFLYFCLPLFLSYCHLCSYLYLSFSNLSSCTTPYHIFLIFVFLCIILFHIVTYALFIIPYSSLYHFDHINERVLHGEIDEVQLATKMKGKARMPSRERSKLHLCIQPQCQWQGCMNLFWS